MENEISGANYCCEIGSKVALYVLYKQIRRSRDLSLQSNLYRLRTQVLFCQLWFITSRKCSKTNCQPIPSINGNDGHGKRYNLLFIKIFTSSVVQ